MTDYIELDCKVTPLQPGTDILIATLAEIGFDSFVETDDGMMAYIPAQQFSEKILDELKKDGSLLFSFQYSIKIIKGKNWNEEWERDFKPVKVDNKCYIRASFHPKDPNVEFDIVIDPKMAFGTGHHETTTLMVQQMLTVGFKNKAVLDMGCGTGILAIMAAKLGATFITAIDNDPVAVESTVENCHKNESPHIIAQCGSTDLISNKKFDIILANINRNILINHLSSYYSSLNQNGIVILSGYLAPDIDAIHNKALEQGLVLIDHKEKNNWIASKFRK